LILARAITPYSPQWLTEHDPIPQPISTGA
jgi:hypothetical protein